MENTIQSDLIRGHINTIILKALFDGDRYGYDIIKEIEQKSSGQYKLKQPTLYSCLNRLEVQGFIRSYWGAKSSGGRRKYYTLTEMGRELFIKNQTEWEYSRTVIDKLISDREVSLENYGKENNDGDNTETESQESALTSENTALGQEPEAVQTPPVQAAESPEEQTTAAMEAAATQTETVPEENSFLDTSAIMEELFRSSGADASYTEKLRAERFVADRTASPASDNYFNDFYDEPAAQSDETVLPERETPPVPVQNSAPKGQSEGDDITIEIPRDAEEKFEQLMLESDERLDIPYRDSSVLLHEESRGAELLTRQHEDLDRTARDDDFSYSDRFLRYDSDPNRDPTADIIRLEYKKILGDIADGCFRKSAEPHESLLPKPETDDAASASGAITEQDSDSEPPAYTADREATRKLDRLSGEMREMGDSVKIRTHREDTSKQYSTMYYYYSNRLMLVHYAILFGVMMLEILGSAIIVFAALKAGARRDIVYYIIAVVIALIFPTVAFIKNYTAPYKRKRINFNLKFSLIFRSIIMVQCFIIIYCVNVFFKMPLSCSIEYISTLLLPALLCTNFPISSLIFSSLFKTKKYAVEE